MIAPLNPSINQFFSYGQEQQASTRFVAKILFRVPRNNFILDAQSWKRKLIIRPSPWLRHKCQPQTEGRNISSVQLGIGNLKIIFWVAPRPTARATRLGSVLR